MSPIWLTSKTPTPPRTALCSATSPPFAGYSTGISQPPKFTIFAPRRRCTPLRGVFRSSGMVGELTDCIPRAREEIDTNMRPESGQRSPTLKDKDHLKRTDATIVPFRTATKGFSPRTFIEALPCRAPYCSGTVFSGGRHAGSRSLFHVRQTGRPVRVRKILHHL